MTADKAGLTTLAVPTSATFDVGVYGDGSGPVARVRYDANSDHVPDQIWIDGGDYSGSWFAFPFEHADGVIAAIKQCAAALHALASKEPTNG